MIFRDLNLYYCARAAVHVVMVCLFLVLNSYAATAKAADFASASACSKCHQEVYQKILTASFRHQRADRECALCHVATEPPRGIDIASTSYKNTVTLKAPETTKDNYRIVIKAKDEAMRESQPLSTLVDITSLAEEVYKGGSLQIFAVKVSEVSQGVFASASITWTTNLPTKGIVRYGLSDKYVESQLDNIYELTETHRMSLSGLKPKSIYHFQIEAEDIVNNKVLSKDFILDTSNIYKLAEEATLDDGSLPVIKSLRFFRIKGDQSLYVDVNTSKPSIISLNLKDGSEPSAHGYGFLSNKFSTIEVCGKCHKPEASHPVRIKVPSAIKTTLELPTIEDGLITCTTCHEPHGGSHSYMLRFEFSGINSTLCIKCHGKNPAIRYTGFSR